MFCPHGRKKSPPGLLRRRLPPIAAAARTHGRVIKTGAAAAAAAGVYIWNTILTSYARWSGLTDAQKLFDEAPERDAVTWNSLIAAQVSHGAHDGAWELFAAMMSRGLAVDQYTCGSVLKSAAGAGDVHRGRQLHSVVVKAGLEGNVFAGSALLDMYSKCSRAEDASSIFSSMPVRNVVSWNAMISSRALAGDRSAALQLFKQMERKGVAPDEATFATILAILDQPAWHSLTSLLHAKVIKSGWALDTIVCNAAITAYAQCGSVGDSRRVFLEMAAIRDLVSWNSMLAAYACDGSLVMRSSWTAARHGHGRAVHGLAVKRGLAGRTPVSNALISMYIKSDHEGSIRDAVRSFDSMEKRDNVSWNSALTGLSQRGLGEEAMKFFCRMRRGCPEIDHYAFSAALRSCSDLAALELGQQLHALLVKSGSASNAFAASSLICMYSRSGAIDSARRSFDESSRDSSEREVKPDHITFVAILSACSHIGLVEEGRKILEAMVSVYGMELRMEHYACGVDLFGRAGRLHEAQKLISSMPFEPNAMVWKPLLGACRIHGDMELAARVAGQLLTLEPEEHSTYVLLSNIYAASGRWGERAMIQRTMREGRVSKVPGWSWIEVKNRVRAFNAEDRSHPEAEEIYQTLQELMQVIAMPDHDEDLDDAMNDLDPTLSQAFPH
ncbi:unnamed protein product [Spirodela intermedia]|uniref:Uncharacterized protein n=1 Tax=Spirodela intermedia TaxID=51605 RepID=A0A7I8JMI7_SPIIN|nr:unnamed protein product [Spirodela intermedia]CAA6671025.1 unnamed protein product [Spirodela intermedia]